MRFSNPIAIMAGFLGCVPSPATQELGKNPVSAAAPVPEGFPFNIVPECGKAIGTRDAPLVFNDYFDPHKSRRKEGYEFCDSPSLRVMGVTSVTLEDAQKGKSSFFEPGKNECHSSPINVNRLLTSKGPLTEKAYLKIFSDLCLPKGHEIPRTPFRVRLVLSRSGSIVASSEETFLMTKKLPVYAKDHCHSDCTYDYRDNYTWVSLMPLSQMIDQGDLFPADWKTSNYRIEILPSENMIKGASQAISFKAFYTAGRTPSGR